MLAVLIQISQHRAPLQPVRHQLDLIRVFHHQRMLITELLKLQKGSWRP